MKGLEWNWPLSRVVWQVERQTNLQISLQHKILIAGFLKDHVEYWNYPYAGGLSHTVSVWKQSNLCKMKSSEIQTILYLITKNNKAPVENIF